MVIDWISWSRSTLWLKQQLCLSFCKVPLVCTIFVRTLCPVIILCVSCLIVFFTRRRFCVAVRHNDFEPMELECVVSIAVRLCILIGCSADTPEQTAWCNLVFFLLIAFLFYRVMLERANVCIIFLEFSWSLVTFVCLKPWSDDNLFIEFGAIFDLMLLFLPG